ncbi:hypothetical protein PHLGIDRAFT_359764 [Phlebiopsis gigantea 11061_1 CR5-6]|uniref:Uncharacterized protein n=1 Tax=Phlebiopsis gigantea (strain 11061_1 CR5-6) TaxID=745531 RepID=A0A0C3P9M1_PHLG1|nr:hypothetical protein PHLGIDRAFT_359764 [Phlebiopsis gigantea 11061_1 CR5-6]
MKTRLGAAISSPRRGEKCYRCRVHWPDNSHHRQWGKFPCMAFCPLGWSTNHRLSCARDCSQCVVYPLAYGLTASRC